MAIIKKQRSDIWNTLRGEIDIEDTYQLRELETGSKHENKHKKLFKWTPRVIFDIGANIGVFTKYCRGLFPEALIIAIEPDRRNANRFRKNIDLKEDRNIIFLEKPIGDGTTTYHIKSGTNGTGEVYLNQNCGYKKYDFSQHKKIGKSIRLKDLTKYINPVDKVVCKIDIEGNETAIFEHAESMEILTSFDYVVIELHYFGSTAEGVLRVQDITKKMMRYFKKKKYKVKYDHPIFKAIKNIS